MEFKYIISNPDICGGVPTFILTRIPIYIILDLLSAGETIETIQKNYPKLSEAHIHEALKYASEITKYREALIEIFDR